VAWSGAVYANSQKVVEAPINVADDIAAQIINGDNAYCRCDARSRNLTSKANKHIRQVCELVVMDSAIHAMLVSLGTQIPRSFVLNRFS